MSLPRFSTLQWLVTVPGQMFTFLVFCFIWLLILFFKYKFIYFNWMIITLQYCTGSAANQHESTTGIHVLPILNPPTTSLPVPSLQVIPVHQPQGSWTGNSFLIWIYTCFHAIPPNHPTLSLSHRVQKDCFMMLLASEPNLIFSILIYLSLMSFPRLSCV